MAPRATNRLTVDVESDTLCELFDLIDDPGELHNLVNEPAHAGPVEKLRNTVLAERTWQADGVRRALERGDMHPFRRTRL